jgi:hypothetical protein
MTIHLSTTKLQYLGKTSKDPFNYKGSGTKCYPYSHPLLFKLFDFIEYHIQLPLMNFRFPVISNLG